MAIDEKPTAVRNLDLEDDVSSDPDDEEEDISSETPNLQPQILKPTPQNDVVFNLCQPLTLSPPPSLSFPNPNPTRIDDKKPPFDDSRRLFQRLWTDDDEIELLQGFLDYSSSRGTHHHDTSQFYDQIRGKLQLEFNKSQLVEKLRRLKKKYRTVVARITSGKDFSFKSPHDRSTFEISQKIWSGNNSLSALPEENPFHEDDAYATPSRTLLGNCHSIELYDPNFSSLEKKGPRKRSRGKVVEKNDSHNSHNAYIAQNLVVGGGSIPSLIEESVRSCMSPMFKELLNNAMAGFGARGLGRVFPLGFGGPDIVNMCGGGDMNDERWRKQQILELEVYAKRLELVQDQIKSTLEELRSMGS